MDLSVGGGDAAADASMMLLDNLETVCCDVSAVALARVTLPPFPPVGWVPEPATPAGGGGTATGTGVAAVNIPAYEIQLDNPAHSPVLGEMRHATVLLRRNTLAAWGACDLHTLRPAAAALNTHLAPILEGKVKDVFPMMTESWSVTPSSEDGGASLLLEYKGDWGVLSHLFAGDAERTSLTRARLRAFVNNAPLLLEAVASVTKVVGQWAVTTLTPLVAAGGEGREEKAADANGAASGVNAMYRALGLGECVAAGVTAHGDGGALEAYWPPVLDRRVIVDDDGTTMVIIGAQWQPVPPASDAGGEGIDPRTAVLLILQDPALPNPSSLLFNPQGEVYNVTLFDALTFPNNEAAIQAVLTYLRAMGRQQPDGMTFYPPLHRDVKLAWHRINGATRTAEGTTDYDRWSYPLPGGRTGVLQTMLMLLDTDVSAGMVKDLPDLTSGRNPAATLAVVRNCPALLNALAAQATRTSGGVVTPAQVHAQLGGVMQCYSDTIAPTYYLSYERRQAMGRTLQVVADWFAPGAGETVDPAVAHAMKACTAAVSAPESTAPPSMAAMEGMSRAVHVLRCSMWLSEYGEEVQRLNLQLPVVAAELNRYMAVGDDHLRNLPNTADAPAPLVTALARGKQLHASLDACVEAHVRMQHQVKTLASAIGLNVAIPAPVLPGRSEAAAPAPAPPAAAAPAPTAAPAPPIAKGRRYPTGPTYLCPGMSMVLQSSGPFGMSVEIVDAMWAADEEVPPMAHHRRKVDDHRHWTRFMSRLRSAMKERGKTLPEDDHGALKQVMASTSISGLYVVGRSALCRGRAIIARTLYEEVLARLESPTASSLTWMERFNGLEFCAWHNLVCLHLDKAEKYGDMLMAHALDASGVPEEVAAEKADEAGQMQSNVEMVKDIAAKGERMIRVRRNDSVSLQGETVFRTRNFGGKYPENVVQKSTALLASYDETVAFVPNATTAEELVGFGFTSDQAEEALWDTRNGTTEACMDYLVQRVAADADAEEETTEEAILAVKLVSRALASDAATPGGGGASPHGRSPSGGGGGGPLGTGVGSSLDGGARVMRMTDLIALLTGRMPVNGMGLGDGHDDDAEEDGEDGEHHDLYSCGDLASPSKSSDSARGAPAPTPSATANGGSGPSLPSPLHTHGSTSGAGTSPSPPATPSRAGLRAAVRALAATNDRGTVQACLVTVKTLCHNIVTSPTDTKYRDIKADNPAIRAKVLNVAGADALLQSLGWAPLGEAPADASVLRYSHPSVAPLANAVEDLEMALSSIAIGMEPDWS